MDAAIGSKTKTIGAANGKTRNTKITLNAKCEMMATAGKNKL